MEDPLGIRQDEQTERGQRYELVFLQRGVAHVITVDSTDMNQESNISLMNDSLVTCHPPSLSLVHTVSVSLFPSLALLLPSCSFFLYDVWQRGVSPSFHSPLNQMPWLDQLLVPRTGEDYFQNGVTHQCLLSLHDK